MMQSLGRRYVQYINHRHQRSGTLWSGRYKTSVIDSETYLLSCYRYIELKPMHNGYVDSPEQYKWSSFNHHTGRLKNDLITEHHLYNKLGKNWHERANQYNKQFLYEIGRASYRERV